MRTAVRTGAGLALGTGTAVAHLVLAVPGACALLVPAARPGAATAVDRLVRVERCRVATLLGGTVDPGPAPSTARSLRYLAGRVPVALLGGAVLVLLALGSVFAATILWAWVTGTSWALDPDPSVVTGWVVAYYVVPGIVLLYLALAGAVGVAGWERALLRGLDAPSREEQLARRVEALADSRAEIVAAVDDERRRIERDLHDGVQQHLVALGMLLGRARRHPDRAADLVVQAHGLAQRAMADLREVSWRVYPAALDVDGLEAALGAVAERSPVPVEIAFSAPEPPAPVRVPAYFVVCEAVTNAAKHSGATLIRVRVEGNLRVEVTDDGRGGADPRGGGLSGLARRVTAADGRFAVDSPPGGPTVVTAEWPEAPCVS